MLEPLLLEFPDRLTIVPNCKVEKLLTTPSSTKGYTSHVQGVEATVSFYPDSDVGPARAAPMGTK